ncbi:MAG TPA: diguanylate cyclase [Gallionellaceae bacterium]|nr:diguanylate cyclase [Gallionellaceae bacterium]
MNQLLRRATDSFRNRPGLALAALLLALCIPGMARADGYPARLQGQWFRAPPAWVYRAIPSLADPALAAVPEVALTGGRFFQLSEFDIAQQRTMVVDFKNTQTIARFHHWIFDAGGTLVGEASGGIESDARNPFFLTFGRSFDLLAGHYKLVTEVDSPFYIAQPQPYLDTVEHYREAIKRPAALGVLCLGILLGLGIYYFALSIARRDRAEAMYALFITGNLLFDSTSLLVLPDLAGVRSFALLGIPLLFSNAVYIVFVLSLLEIRRATHPRLYRLGLILLALLAVFAAAGLALPHLALELERTGVAMFLLFGMAAGITRAREGNITARFYLAAVSLFLVFGGITITASRLTGIYTLHVEHLGALAVTIEVLALALVLSYQFARMKEERETALSQHTHSQRLARTDALTGLPNRLALEEDLTPLPEAGWLAFIDMDGLKYYNDKYGHDRGDELLCAFANQLCEALGKEGRVYRLGGDEFAIVSRGGEEAALVRALEKALAVLREQGFEQAAASHGTAHMREASSRHQLMNLADQRMYARKHESRREPGAAAPENP